MYITHRIIKNLFACLVPAPSGCWEYGGARSKGYGHMKVGRAHRVMWAALHGPIPTGLCVLHTCDNPPCCNPSHLFLGTKNDNMQDMIAKRRAVHPAMLVDMVGERFGHLVVVSLNRVQDRHRAYWNCRCDCGAMTVVERTKLLRKTKPTRQCWSCGARQSQQSRQRLRV